MRYEYLKEIIFSKKNPAIVDGIIFNKVKTKSFLKNIPFVYHCGLFLTCET